MVLRLKAWESRSLPDLLNSFLLFQVFLQNFDERAALFERLFILLGYPIICFRILKKYLRYALKSKDQGRGYGEMLWHDRNLV